MGRGTEVEMADVSAAYLDEARRSFRGHKRLAEGAISQLEDEQLHMQVDAESNSVAIIMRHLVGNMRSRFTDFLTSDGEKPDRNRDGEFDEHLRPSRQELMRAWEAGWEIVFRAIEPLKPEDLLNTVTIRNEPHTVLQAINRQVAHYAYHVGQIVFVAKHLKGSEWKSLSIPKGHSETAGQDVEKQRKSDRE
jgi:hypothetical protein